MSIVDQSIEINSEFSLARVWEGEWRMRMWLPCGSRLSFWGDEDVWNRWGWWLHNIVNVLNVSTLFTPKWLVLH